MRRGEIWTVATGSGYGSKPRPCVIVQAEAFDTTDSVTVAICTTVLIDAPFRVMIPAGSASGLRHPTAIMADKLLTVQRTNLGERVGQLGPDELAALNRALVVFLGLAETVPSEG